MSPDAAYTTALRTGGQHRVDVVGGRDPELAAEPAEVARVAADLVGVVDEHGRELQRRMGVDGTDGRAADVAGTPDDRGDHARRVARGRYQFLVP